MKRKIHLLLPFVLLAVVFTACEETEEQGKYYNWRERNEAFIDSLQQVYDAKTDLELRVIKDNRSGNNIFYKILNEGDITKKRPYSTSTVNAYYRGMFIDEAVFNAFPNEKYYTKLYKELYVFTSATESFAGDNPDPLIDATHSFVLNASTLSSGFSEAIQWMYPGARWEIYLPYQTTAYGSSGSNDGKIPGYSTLIFDLTLESIAEY